MKKNILLSLLVILGITYIFSRAYSSPVPKNLLEEYRYSQYCLGGYRAQHGWDKLSPQYSLWCNSEDDYRGMMDDPELYTLSGILYLKRADPASINPELQPLTKYLFGASQVLFGTPLAAQYLALGIIILILYQLGGFLPPILFLLDSLVRSQLGVPYLDLVQTLFILLFIVNIRSPRRAMVILGLAALAKSFSIGFVLVLVLLLYLFLTDKKKIALYLKSSYLAIFTYFVGYTAFFFYHHPFDFFTLHLNTLKLYHSYVSEYPVGEVFRIIFTGKWLTWYGDHGLIAAPGWSLLWPLSFSASIIALFISKLRQNLTLLPHLLWIIFYLAFVSLRLVFPRYLIPVLPSLYLVLVYAVQEIRLPPRSH